jgi:Cys-rich protein (TIGR01571 family)
LYIVLRSNKTTYINTLNFRHAMSSDMEQQPLLGKPATGIPAAPTAAPKVAPRQWRNQWYEVFGSGSPVDVAACCLAFKVPCVAWGWNQTRGLQLSFWSELVRFVALTVGVSLGLHLACCVLMMTLCPEGVADFDDDADWHHGPHRLLLHPHGDDMEEEGPGIPQECVARVAPAYLVLAGVAITLIIYVSLFFARRRTALRERFGIEGTTTNDQLLYVCCGPCALAQETRTLMHEQVHEGVWYGALPGVAAPATAVPVAQKMAM